MWSYIGVLAIWIPVNIKMIPIISLIGTRVLYSILPLRFFKEWWLLLIFPVWINGNQEKEKWIYCPLAILLQSTWDQNLIDVAECLLAFSSILPFRTHNSAFQLLSFTVHWPVTKQSAVNAKKDGNDVSPGFSKRHQSQEYYAKEWPKFKLQSYAVQILWLHVRHLYSRSLSFLLCTVLSTPTSGAQKQPFNTGRNMILPIVLGSV